MLQRIFSHQDRNMAGDNWRWDFYLNCTANKRFTLSCKGKTLDSSNRDGGEQRVRSHRGLRGGADISDAFRSIAGEVGCDFSDADFLRIADAIASIDAHAAAAFRREVWPPSGPSQVATLPFAKEWEQLSADVKSAIDEFLMRFDDTPTSQYVVHEGRIVKYPGGKWRGSSVRATIKMFIELHFKSHGRLPTGKQDVGWLLKHDGEVYSGSEDFSDLGPRQT